MHLLKVIFTRHAYASYHEFFYIFAELHQAVAPVNFDLDALVTRHERSDPRQALLPAAAHPDEHCISPRLPQHAPDPCDVNHRVREENQVHLIREGHIVLVQAVVQDLGSPGVPCGDPRILLSGEFGAACGECGQECRVKDCTDPDQGGMNASISFCRCSLDWIVVHNAEDCVQRGVRHTNFCRKVREVQAGREKEEMTNFRASRGQNNRSEQRWCIYIFSAVFNCILLAIFAEQRVSCWRTTFNLSSYNVQCVDL